MFQEGKFLKSHCTRLNLLELVPREDLRHKVVVGGKFRVTELASWYTLEVSFSEKIKRRLFVYLRGFFSTKIPKICLLIFFRGVFSRRNRSWYTSVFDRFGFTGTKISASWCILWFGDGNNFLTPVTLQSLTLFWTGGEANLPPPSWFS